MKLNELKKNVTGGMTIRLTFDGAFQRARIYDNKASDKDKKKFRNYMALKLPKILSDIQKRKRYTDKDHYRMLERFSEQVTNTFKGILGKRKFRIGNAQKFLNLYWKMSWLMNSVRKKPIHCPFDSIIINRLPKKVRVSWTEFDTIEEYRNLVEAARVVSKNKSIAEWEMDLYWNKQNGNK